MSAIAPNYEFTLARYNVDGSLDTSFGSGGIVTTFITDQDQASAVIVQPDGKIVVAGRTHPLLEAFTVARYQADGSLDASFGNGGIVTADFGGSAEAFALALQPDGRIVAGGDAFFAPSSDYAFGLARFTPDGSPDESFGNRGVVTTNFSSEGDSVASLTLQHGGTIVASGRTCTIDTGCDFAVARYRLDGSLDATFGHGGTTTTSIAWFDQANALVATADGGIVAAGSSLDFNEPVAQPSPKFALVRYLGAADDTTPPELAVPSSATADATGPSGASVTYTVSASDPDDAVASLTCTPPSGALFSIGITTVYCSATDTNGNSRSASFGVQVNGAAEQIAALMSAVAPLGPGTSLRDKLRQAQAFVAAGNVSDACQTLGALIHETSAQSGKGVPVTQAATLVADVGRIRKVLGCKSPSLHQQ